MLARRVRRVRRHARARRAHRRQRRQPRPQALPHPVGRRHRRSCRTTSGCSCAARSSGRRARARAASCAWGSFRSPANPVLRDLTERVVIASKGRFDRAVDRAAARAARPARREPRSPPTSSWRPRSTSGRSPPESATRVGHPAPFPVELPQRLIDLYTYRDDLVLDPFMGSGTTAVAAVRTGRHYVGYDTDEAYAKAARARVAAEVEALPDDAVRAAGPGHRGRRRAPPRRRLQAGRCQGHQAASLRRGARRGLAGHRCQGTGVGGPRGRRQHRRPHRAASLRRPVPHARGGVGAHLGRPPRAGPHHRPSGGPLGAAGRAAGGSGSTLVDAIELGAPGAAARLAVYAAGEVDGPVGDLLPGT